MGGTAPPGPARNERGDCACVASLLYIDTAEKFTFMCRVRRMTRAETRQREGERQTNRHI